MVSNCFNMNIAYQLTCTEAPLFILLATIVLPALIAPTVVSTPSSAVSGCSWLATSSG